MVDKYNSGGRSSVYDKKTSIFEKSEDNMKKYNMLKAILEESYPDLDPAKLEGLIKKNDQQVKYLILKSFRK